MIIISEAARFRQRVIKYSFKKGVTAESRYFRGSRNTIYECRNKTSNTIPKICLNFLSPNKAEKYLGMMQESLQQSLRVEGAYIKPLLVQCALCAVRAKAFPELGKRYNA